MDKNFTFRFYNVSRSNNQIPSMVSMLKQAVKEPNKQKREVQLAQDYVIRLENLHNDGADAVVGEFVRCQGTNLPGELDGATRKSLTAKKLAHSIVFRLNHVKGILGVQHDPRVVSVGRILDYLSFYNVAAQYRLDPRINPDAWKKFNGGDTRKLSVRIANPDSMDDLGGDGKAASQGIKAMADAYDAPSILIELSMGHRKGFLSSKVSALAELLATSVGAKARVDKLTAVTVVNDVSEEIDLIEDRQVLKDTLSIDDRDPDKNYKIKAQFLSTRMKKLMG
ncbi:hypothetical protein [Pararhizobium sp. DWP1-1-3]|uniref:hypothetical protein n=1 Tax=Pararhizobium sp. DWP1-1-3 TaxID=2804652 RepID=UPI003CF40901